jgi:TonB family protein
MEMNGPAVHQTQWYTANGDFSTGDSWWPAWEYKLVADAISGSLPDAQQVEKNFPERFTEKIGSLRLHCAKLSGTRYCFSGIPPVLRIEVTPATEAISDGLVRFQGRYVAQDIRVLRMGMPNLEIHLEKIELLDGIKAADFTHAPGARMISARSPRIGKLTPGRKISGEGPKYPADAKSRHIEGTVMLWATIGTDGSLHHVEVIGGPAVLQQSAVDAVSTWHYEPYLYNGQPVPMSTEIDVVYSIGS